MSTMLQDSLHTISQMFMIPAIVILVLLIILSIAAIGSIIIEALTERRLLKGNLPGLMAALHGKTVKEMRDLISTAGILKRQKASLNQMLDYEGLPDVELQAIAKRLIATEETHYNKKLARTDIIAKIAPMFGLMGTLIPLGPGIVALGGGDTKTLADSLLVAFDTTVAGLISAVICYFISKIRSVWYEDYMVTMESMMECILEELSAESGTNAANNSSSSSSSASMVKEA